MSRPGPRPARPRPGRFPGWLARPARRTWSILAGAGILFLVGSNVQAGWLYVIGASMVGAVAAGLVLPALAVRGVEVSRRVPQAARAGDPVDVELELRTRSGSRRGTLEGADRFLGESGFVVDGVAREGPVRLRYAVAARRRGAYEGAEVVLASGAPFGAGVARRRIPVPSPIVVHPRWVPLAGIPLLEAASTPFEPLHERRRRGAGQDFFGLREYRPGDSLRHVHWPSTARGGRLLVREYEEQPASRLGVLIDAGEPVGEEPETTFEDSVAVAASLALYALEAGHPVQLFCDSRRGTLHLFEPGRVDALDWLARLEADGRRGLSRVAEDAAGEVQRRSTNALVFASTRRNAAEVLKAAAVLQDRAARVLAVVLSAESYAGRRSGDALTPAEEGALAEELVAARALVYRVKRGEDLAQCLREPLRA